MPNSTSKRTKKGIPVKTITTRHKSQHQQHNDNKQPKSVTKSESKQKPPEKYVSKRKKNKPSKEANDVVVLEDNRDFYPDKPKRNIQCKKVVLKPVHSMKMIGGISSLNKRKLNMPQKDIKRTRQNSDSPTSSDNVALSPKQNNQTTDLSIRDMVLLIEEQGGLDDEELLEILTCPSPVWWEDPPDGYIEEPIFTRPKPAEQMSVKNQLLEEQSKEAERRKQRAKNETEGRKDTYNMDVSKLSINVKDRGMSFVEKRSKLESMLNKIRNKAKNNSDGSKGDNTRNIMAYGSNEIKNAKCVKDDVMNTNHITVSKPKNVKENIVKAVNTKKKCNLDTNKKQEEEEFSLKQRNLKRKLSNSTKDSLAVKPKISKIDRKNGSDKRKSLVIKMKDVLKCDEILHDNINKNEEVKSKIVKNIDENKNNEPNVNLDLKIGNKVASSSPNMSFEEEEEFSLKQRNRKRKLSNSTKDSLAVKPKISKIDRKNGSDKRKSLVIKMKDVLKCDEILHDNINKNEEVKSKIVKNIDENKNNEPNVNLDLKIGNKVASSSPNMSFEEDNLIDLAEHEIDSLEKSEIPIAPKIIKPMYKITKSVKKGIDLKATKADLSSIKMNNTFLYDKFVNKPFSYTTDNDVKFWENDVGKCVSDEITKYADDASDISSNNDKSNQKINNVSYVRVRKFESVINSTNDNIFGKIVSNKSASESGPFIASTKNDIRSDNTACKKVDKLYFKNTNPSYKTETSSYVEKIKNVCSKNSKATAVSSRRSKKKETFIICNNNRLQNRNDDGHATAVCSITHDRATDKAFIKINEEYDDLRDIKKTSASKNNFVSYNLSENDFTNVEIEKKLNYNHKESETEVEIHNVRRYSIDSASSDKNMSVEYLDMSLLDEDENKIAPERQNNEVSCESDYQNNESCNNDTIQHIRNDKNMDNVKNKNIAEHKIFNAGIMTSKNFRCSSPIHQKKGTLNNGSLRKYNSDKNQHSQYNTIFKIANNDSGNECNLYKTDEVKDNNNAISKKINETEDSYDVEYLNEFDEVVIVGTTIHTNEDQNASINKIREDNLVRINKIENITENRNTQKNFIKLNEAVDTAVVKYNENNLTNPADVSKINNYFKQRKEVRHDNIPSNIASGVNPRQSRADACKSYTFKNKSILIADNKTVKYCYVCSSIYDIDPCKYCIKKLKCRCKTDDVFICDKCSVKLSKKKSIIKHLNGC